MKVMSDREINIVNTLVESFYKIVPLEFKTFCSLTSRISKSTLLHFGIKADLLPCQVWLVTPEQNFVVGFSGKPSAPGQWDGHVVCSTGNFIIDTALFHFNRDFGLNVPHVAVTTRFQVLTQVIARLDLNTQNGLWWHCPPSSEGIDLKLPDEPPELIAKYSAQLIEHMSALGIPVRENLTLDRKKEIANFSLHKM